jgi:ribosomal-protein-serine acetyltransferase
LGEYLTGQMMLLKSRDIYLRFLRKSDAARMFAAVEESREELEKYVIGPTRLHSVPEVEQIEHAMIMRKKRQGYVFGIFTTAGKQLVGCISMHSVTEGTRSGEIGCWVRTSQTGKGIATAAVALIMLFGFKVLKLHRIVLRAAIDNPASRRIAERMDFVYEGTQRHEELRQRGWVDLKCYSMLEDEYHKLKPKITKLAKGRRN